jgi:hypothetical protein
MLNKIWIEASIDDPLCGRILVSAVNDQLKKVFDFTIARGADKTRITRKEDIMVKVLIGDITFHAT